MKKVEGIAGDYYEASMNFDMENVLPFLQQIEAAFALGLDPEHLAKRVAEAEPDTSYGSDLNLTFEGQPVNMKFSAYIDDFDAPDLTFFVTSEELAKGIDAEMERFCEARGI